MATQNNLNNSSAPFTLTSGTCTITSGNLIVTAGNVTLPITSSSGVGGIQFGGARWLNTYKVAADNNTLVGYGCSNTTLTSGTAVNNTYIGAWGNGSLPITTGANNTVLGSNSALASLTSSSGNSVFGYEQGIFITSGTGQNTFAGWRGPFQLTTGSNNVAIGFATAQNYNSSESSNIVIGANNSATNAESHVLRIYSSSSTKCFIAGITGSTVVGSALLCSAGSVLGTVVSSAKYKNDIVDMDDSAVLHKLRPTTFTMKNDPSKHKQWGCIAEEVNKVCPDLVINNEETKEIESVRYLDMIPMLLKEIQKLKSDITEWRVAHGNQ